MELPGQMPHALCKDLRFSSTAPPFSTTSVCRPTTCLVSSPGEADTVHRSSSTILTCGFYFKPVIAHGWRTQKLVSNRFWFHDMPLLFGIGLALGGIHFYESGIPYYESTAVVCTILFPPYKDTWFPIIFFTFIPIFLAISATTVMMIQVYVYVR
jgi:hypothetical protein